MVSLSHLYFPSVNDDCTIYTEPFLCATKEIINLLDKFGKVFTQVKYDMQTNLDILTKRYNSDKVQNITIQSMMHPLPGPSKNRTVDDAFMWLRRELEFVFAFFQKMVSSYKSNASSTSEDLLIPLKSAYSDSLENYHNWMAQQLFGLLTRMAPTRTQLLNIIANKSTDNHDLIIEELSRFLETFKPVLLNLVHHPVL